MHPTEFNKAMTFLYSEWDSQIVPLYQGIMRDIKNFHCTSAPAYSLFFSSMEDSGVHGANIETYIHAHENYINVINQVLPNARLTNSQAIQKNKTIRETISSLKKDLQTMKTGITESMSSDCEDIFPVSISHQDSFTVIDKCLRKIAFILEAPPESTAPSYSS